MSDHENENKISNFIRDVIQLDLAAGRVDKIVTRFPPEPNGYLHIGHAKAICIDFGMAREFNGECHLRMDDTNPSKEDQEYIDAIMRDVEWLGFDYGGKVYYASDCFEQMYQWAELLIQKGVAYVDDLTAEEIRSNRGTLTEAGLESPYRNRGVEENLDLFRRMRSGEFPDGARVLRAKIDMSSPNLNLRDPVMYRILHQSHPRTQHQWHIYPMYDWAHGLEDSLEKITHSLCTLEFEDHRPLYDWFLDQLEIFHPRQYEFARLNLTYTVMSKRKLKRLVDEGFVSGWDDPRMPTLSGLRRRGYTPASIRIFSDKIGVAKRASMVDVSFLEYCIREELNKCAPRYMAVIDPLKLVIENYPESQEETLNAIMNPEDPSAGFRQIPFARELYIEREDFMENPPKQFFRLAPGREVRLRYAYFITCHSVVHDPETGQIVELRCTYDPATRGGDAPDGRKVKATLHWVSAKHAVNAEVRLYNHLFIREDPEQLEPGEDFTSLINSDSIQRLNECRLEPALKELPLESRVQFERLGYFIKDIDTTDEKPVFNRIVTLKDTWAKLVKSGKTN